MTPSQSQRDPLAPDLTLAVLDEVRRRAVLPDPDREDWVEVLMHELPSDWRMVVSADVARAGPLRPDGRAFLPQLEWEARARRLWAEATIILHFRDALLFADRGPSSDELNDSVRLDPWQAWDFGGVGPYVSGRLQDPEPSRPGWTAPVLLLALGPDWGRMLHSWRRLGRYQVRPEYDEGPGPGARPGRRVLDESELAAALANQRQWIERFLEGLRPPREGSDADERLEQAQSHQGRRPMSEHDPLPSSGWSNILFGLSGPEIRERALASGGTEPVGLRLGQLVEALGSAAQRSPLTFGEFVANPDQALVSLDTHVAWRTMFMGDYPPEAVLVPRLDLALLIGLLLDRAGPRWATGADLYARFSHAGPPHPITMNPPPEPPYRTPTLEEALRSTGAGAEETVGDEDSKSADLPARGTAQAGAAPAGPGAPAEGDGGVRTDPALEEVGQLLARVYAMFRTDMGWWVGIPNVFLGHRRPCDCLATAEGRQQLDEHLSRLEAGIYV